VAAVAGIRNPPRQIGKGCSRPFVNQQVGSVERVVRWAVRERTAPAGPVGGAAGRPRRAANRSRSSDGFPDPCNPTRMTNSVPPLRPTDTRRWGGRTRPTPEQLVS